MSNFQETFPIVFRRSLYINLWVANQFVKEGLQFANAEDGTEIYLHFKSRHNLITIKGFESPPPFEFIQTTIEEVGNHPLRKYAIVIEGCNEEDLPRGFYKTEKGVEYGYIPSIAIRYDTHLEDDSVDSSTYFLGAMSYDLFTDLKKRVSEFSSPMLDVHVVGYEVDEEETPIYEEERPISSFYQKGICFIFGDMPHSFDCLM